MDTTSQNTRQDDENRAAWESAAAEHDRAEVRGRQLKYPSHGPTSIFTSPGPTPLFVTHTHNITHTLYQTCQCPHTHTSADRKSNPDGDTVKQVLGEALEVEKFSVKVTTFSDALKLFSLFVLFSNIWNQVQIYSAAQQEQRAITKS